MSNGVLLLRLDTYNPTAIVAGDSFWGSEIVTRRVFERGNGLRIRARLRMARPAPPGLVASLFSYVTYSGRRDEIDVELLTNDGGGALTNLFTNERFDVAGRPQFVPLPGASIWDFNDYEIVWLPDRVQWIVNGRLVREETRDVPREPITVRLNFWAPSADFAGAFDPTLRPAVRRDQNQTFFYEVDDVEIAAVDAMTVPAQ